MTPEEKKFADWYRKHAKTAEGRKEGPPDGILRALRKFPAERDRPFLTSPYANAGGRWASLATAATLGRLVYDAGIPASISKPYERPAWLSERDNERRWRDAFWTDLERTLDGHDALFGGALRRVHAETFFEAAPVVTEKMAEFGTLLAGMLEPTMLALQDAFTKACGELPAGSFMRVVWPNVFIPVMHWYAFRLIGDKPAADALYALVDDFRFGLPLGGHGETVHGAHPIIVLTA